MLFYRPNFNPSSRPFFRGSCNLRRESQSLDLSLHAGFVKKYTYIENLVYVKRCSIKSVGYTRTQVFQYYNFQNLCWQLRQRVQYHLNFASITSIKSTD